MSKINRYLGLDLILPRGQSRVQLEFVLPQKTDIGNLLGKAPSLSDQLEILQEKKSKLYI